MNSNQYLNFFKKTSTFGKNPLEINAFALKEGAKIRYCFDTRTEGSPD
jgi:hypothetical protein